MNYGAGFKATYYAAIIDPLSWTETDRLDITSGSIKRQKTGVRQTADIQATDYDQTQELWIRVFMDARQGEDITHEAVFTGIVSAPERTITGTAVSRPLACYSVLKPCEDIVLQRGWYAGAGENGAAVLRRLLTASPAPVVFNGNTPNLSDHIVAESNETNLSMIDKVLEAIGWVLSIDGDGTIEISPKPTQPKYIFGTSGLDIVETSLTISHNWYACPNVFRATSGDMIYVARDDDPNSPLSTVARGREVVQAEDDVSLSSDEGIAEYAERRLKEEQQNVVSAEYSRVFIPDLNVGDNVKLVYPQISGAYVVEEQNIELTYGGRTTEKVIRTAEPENAVELPEKEWALVVLPDDKYFVMPDGYRVLVPYSTLIHS